MFDIEMMRTIGYCHGIENYSRHFTRRLPGEPPPTLLDYLPADVSAVHRRIAPDRAADRRHVRRRPLPQVDAGELRFPHAVGARQPAADVRGVREPRPPDDLRFGHAGAVRDDEDRPAWWSSRSSGRRAWSIPRSRCGPIEGPGGRPAGRDPHARRTQRARAGHDADQAHVGGPAAEYYAELGVKCSYMHSEIETLERVKILRDLRRGEFDVLIGINLLREGLDLPEVSLVGDSRRRQGGLPALGRFADPDHRPRGAQHQRPRHPLRRRDDRFDEAGDRRDRAPAHACRRPTIWPTASRRRRS